MKKKYSFLIVLAVSVSLSVVNCRNVTHTSSNTADDKVISDERTVGPFEGIGLAASADIKLVQGSPQKVVVEGAAEDVEKIVTEVEGSKLKITTKHGTWHLGKVTCLITMENIKELSISGSGSIMAEKAISVNDLELGISGSGDITLADVTRAAEVESHISGSGTITLSGKAEAKKHEVHISGSGDVKSEKFHAQDAEVHISGSGNCNLAVSGKLQVRVSGSGDVYYTGKPVIDASISGSGKLKETTF